MKLFAKLRGVLFLERRWMGEINISAQIGYVLSEVIVIEPSVLYAMLNVAGPQRAEICSTWMETPSAVRKRT